MSNLDPEALVNLCRYGGSKASVKRCRALLASGEVPLDHQDMLNHTALIWAATNGNAHIARELIDAGAALDMQSTHPQTRESQWTALICAARFGHAEIAADLARAGAALDVQDDQGWTALMIAVMKGHAEIVRELLRSGASRDVEGEKGVTAGQIAAEFDYGGDTEMQREIAGLLESVEARAVGDVGTGGTGTAAAAAAAADAAADAAASTGTTTEASPDREAGGGAFTHEGVDLGHFHPLTDPDDTCRLILKAAGLDFEKE